MGKHTQPILFGLLGQKPMIQIKWTDSKFKMTPEFSDLPMNSFAQWNSLKVGNVLLITMEKHMDGKLYPKLV